MKKSILLAALVLVIGGQAFAKKLKPITIKNNTGHNILVSWGYNARQLRSFIVWIPKNKTMKIADWDVDRPTHVFVDDPGKFKFVPGRGAKLVGSIYVMPLGKAIDLKVDNRGVHSNSTSSIFGAGLKDKDIFTKCVKDKSKIDESKIDKSKILEDDEPAILYDSSSEKYLDAKTGQIASEEQIKEAKFAMVPIDECKHKFPTYLEANKDTRRRKFIAEKGLFKDFENITELQDYINQLRDSVVRTIANQ